VAYIYIIDKVLLNGQQEQVESKFESDTIIIGRGGRSELLLDGRLVSLEHAKLSLEESGLVVSDLKSLSGILVNGKSTRRAVLRSGDELTVADVQFKITQNGSDWTLYRQIKQEQGESLEAKSLRLAKKLNLRTQLPSVALLTFFLLALILVGFFVVPYSGINTQPWSVGPLTRSHTMLETDCASCHGAAFTPIEDQQCLSCHNMSEHSSDLPGFNDHHPELHHRCADCHIEHKGENKLILSTSRLCTECHGDLPALHPDSSLKAVPSLAAHPDFDIGDGVDNSAIKLNHKLHLAEMNSLQGVVTLNCNDCHQLSADGKTMRPISFIKDCQSCHPLTFDERFADLEVPHGDPKVVFQFLYAQYTQLALEKRQDSTVREEQRLRPGSEAKSPADTTLPFTQSVVLEETRFAEHKLFEQTACHLCHEITKKAEIDPESNLSLYEVQKPEIPQHWFKRALFDHAAHNAVSCESCHEQAQNSTVTSDLLLPDLKMCQSCHGDQGEFAMVQTNCIDCHSYHKSLPLDLDRKRQWHDYVTRR